MSEVRRMEQERTHSCGITHKLYVSLTVGSVYFLGRLHLSSSFMWALCICWKSISPSALRALRVVCFALVVECLKPEWIISTLVNLQTKGRFVHGHTLTAVFSSGQ